jgi:hypothetical protein
MKNLMIGLTFALSFSAMASSYVEDSAYIPGCGQDATVELRSFADGQGAKRYSLRFVNVTKCGTVFVDYEKKPTSLTNQNGKHKGQFKEATTINLSNIETAAAESNAGLAVVAESRTGEHFAAVFVKIKPVYVPAPAPAPAPAPYRAPRQDRPSTGWGG